MIKLKRFGELYIRRLHHKDYSRSVLMGYKIALFRSITKNVYVSVRHGFPHDIIDISNSKLSIKRKYNRKWKEASTFFKIRRKKK